MARPRSKNNAVCQNEKCLYFRKLNGKEVTKQGKNYAGHQRFLCKHCNVAFVGTKGTPLYQKKMSERKIKSICKELVEKKGVRAVERSMHVHRDTISDLMHSLAMHAKEITPYLVHNLGLNTYEVDELWTFVKKNLKGLNPTTINSLNQARQSLRPA